jgi:PAS domain-containing protein
MRWVLERLPASGRAYRYSRALGAEHDRQVISIELHVVSAGSEQLIVATIDPTEAPETTSDASVLEMVLDRAPVGVVVYDRDLRIVRVTRRVEEMGRIMPQHIGMRLEDAIPDANQLVIAAIRQVFQSGEVVINLESSGADGEACFLVNLFPIGQLPGEPEWVGCIFSDVTERVLAERALAESEQHRREILANLLQAQEDERSRVATELHDDTVQVMTAALLSMDRLPRIRGIGAEGSPGLPPQQAGTVIGSRRVQGVRLHLRIGTIRCDLESARAG